MYVNPGELKHKIQIIETTAEKNPNGYDILVESTFYECYAKVANVSGTEIIKSGAEFTDVKTRFLIRFKAGLNEDMFILFKNKRFNITYMNNYGYSDEYIEIFAEKKELV